MSLNFSGNIEMARSEFGVNNMKAWILVSVVQTAGGGGEGGIFLAHFEPLSTELFLNATAYEGIVADHILPFMTTVYPSSDSYFQQDNAPCHKAYVISNWFLEQDNELTVLRWPPHSPDLNPVEHLWDVLEPGIHIMDVQLTDLQQLS